MGYKPDDHWIVCQRTGKKHRRSEMKQEWTGIWVYKDVWEPRQPQLDVRSIPDKTSADPSSPAVTQVVGETVIIDFCNS